MIDENLSWKSHISVLNDKLRRISYIIRCVRGFLDRPTLKMVYFALVQSLLAYGVIGWGACCDSNLRILQVTQKSIIKNMFKYPRLFPSTQLFIELRFLTIRHLFVKKALLYVAKSPSDLRRSQQDRVTRRMLSYNLEVPFRNTVFGQRQFACVAPRAFNCLPEDIREIGNANILRQRISEWILNLTTDDLQEVLDRIV
jgi:hypothetical protein